MRKVRAESLCAGGTGAMHGIVPVWIAVTAYRKDGYNWPNYTGKGSNVWSSSPNANNSSNAWILNFNNGNDNTNNKNNNN